MCVSVFTVRCYLLGHNFASLCANVCMRLYMDRSSCFHMCDPVVCGFFLSYYYDFLPTTE